MAAQLSIDVSEKADMCKFMEEKKLAMSMDTESQINILEENLKRMEKIHQKNLLDNPVHKAVYSCNHESSNLAQVLYLYDYQGVKIRKGVCSQADCNRLYPHPPLYKRYENWNHSHSDFHIPLHYEDFQFEAQEAKKMIEQLEVLDFSYLYFSSKCTIWWKDFRMRD